MTPKQKALLNHPTAAWYGPHPCKNCGMVIVKIDHQVGDLSLNAPHDHHYPGHKWAVHVCGLVKHIAQDSALLSLPQFDPEAYGKDGKLK